VEEQGITSPPASEEVVAEATRLVRAAAQVDVPLRLFGGTAVWVRCPTARTAPLARPYADIDFASRARERQEIGRFFEAQGYVGERLFNALHGATRLIFADPTTGRPVDVVFDEFVMCHAIDLRDRLEVDDVTLPLADLLLTKLQIVQLNEKDLLDILALLADHPIDRSDREAIDLDRIDAVTGDDWGLEHTMRRTLDRAREAAGQVGLVDEVGHAIRERIDELTRALDVARKTRKWRLRARVGERVRWYRLPEEARR